ncbi:hypothetical protein AMK59_7454, partial [Oryctes borbonicus]
MSVNFIPTRGSKKKKDEEIDFSFIVHQSYKPKEKQVPLHPQPAKSKDAISEATDEINMKRARFEIIKFGMSGFNKQKKVEAKVQLAIKLGAKPPKQKYKNYKDVLKEKRKERIKEEKRKLKLQQGRSQITQISAYKKHMDKRRKKEKGILDIYGTAK